jgi:hypothetical protein
MKNLRAFKQKLSTVNRLWERKDYVAALAEVEGLIEGWPGNGHLSVLWACLVQLQDDPKHDLDDVKRALQRAIDLEPSSPAAAIELGHFLDAVEDDPGAASRAYAGGVVIARRLLIEGLIGQAKALLQLDKREESFRCLLEAMHLMRFEMKGPFAGQIEEVLGEVLSNRSA